MTSPILNHASGGVQPKPKGAGRDQTEIKIKGKAEGESVIRIESEEEIDCRDQSLERVELGKGFIGGA